MSQPISRPQDLWLQHCLPPSKANRCLLCSVSFPCSLQCSHPQPCWLTAPSPQICSALPLPSHCAKEHLPTLTLTMTNFTSKIQTSTVLIVQLNIYILSAKNNLSFKKHVTLLTWKKNSSSELKVTYFKVIQLSCFFLFFNDCRSFIYTAVQFFISFNGFHLRLGYTLMLRLDLQWRKRLKHGTQTALTFLQFLFFILLLRDGIITFTFKSKHSFLVWLYQNMLLNKNQIPFKALPSKTCTFQFHFFTLGFPQRPTARD